MNDLTFEQLTTLVSEASGWGDSASISFRRGQESALIYVSVEICGSKHIVSAAGSDHRKALMALLQNIEMHHHENLRWHKVRCEGTRKILDAHGIYYVKVGL